jgi:hypothetical protein
VTQLCEGQRVSVLQLPVSQTTTAPARERTAEATPTSLPVD